MSSRVALVVEIVAAAGQADFVLAQDLVLPLVPITPLLLALAEPPYQLRQTATLVMIVFFQR